MFDFLEYNKKRILRKPRYLVTQRVRTFLAQEPDLTMPAEEAKKIQKFLRWNLVSFFNAPFVHYYNHKRYHMQYDTEKSMWFTYTPDEKKLYFKKGLNRMQAINTYRALEIEQDPHSPHYYFFDKLSLSKNSIIADIGVAEGNFGLKIVDQIKELYLFECDAEWIEALEATFEPWKNKVHIVNRFVSNTTSSDTVRLDDFFKDKNVPHLLKMDVEGAEASVLEGASELLRSRCVSDLLVCTYHRPDDSERLSAILEGFNYSISFSQGYMLWLQDWMNEKPHFRKGLLHASLK